MPLRVRALKLKTWVPEHGTPTLPRAACPPMRRVGCSTQYVPPYLRAGAARAGSACASA